MWKKAQGLQTPAPCSVEPTLGNSEQPNAGPEGGADGGAEGAEAGASIMGPEVIIEGGSQGGGPGAERAVSSCLVPMSIALKEKVAGCDGGAEIASARERTVFELVGVGHCAPYIGVVEVNWDMPKPMEEGVHIAPMIGEMGAA